MSDIADRVRKIVVEHLNVDAEKVVDKASFIDDLGADSLDQVELVMAFEEEFSVEIPDDAAESIRTFGDAVSYLTGSLPLGLETVGSVTQIVADIVFHDLGDDYLRRYRTIIRGLSAEQLIETMRKYIDPQRLAIAVVKPEGA